MTECVTCARRGRTTELEQGHVCAPCAVRLGDDLDAIARLASQASTEPRTGRGSGRTVPASRPPIDLAGVDPALTTVTVGSGPTTVLEVVESWERLLRDHRRMSPYGPVSAERAATAARYAQGRYAGTLGLLRACTAFLRVQLEWMTTEPTWPIDDLADELRACVRALRHLDTDREPAATVVPCPTVHVEGDCGQRLRLDADHVRCPRCGRDWDADQLVRSATTDATPPDVWVDAEAAAAAVGVSARTIRSWAARGIVRRRHSAYRLTDVLAAKGA